jgi:DNA-directed RNA polymerase subunit RPC12/RpoP
LAEPSHRRRPSIFDYDWHHPLTWISGIAFVGAILAIIVAAFVPGSGPIAFLSNVLTLIASSLISHLITYSNERKQFAQHLAKFSAFAKRRVDILCTDLNLLSIEIERTPDHLDAKHIVQYALKNLEQDARASVQDIDDMRRLDQDDDNPSSEQSPPLINQQLAETPPLLQLGTQLATAEEKVIYSCPHCGYSNTGVLPTKTGSTQHVECANCRTRLLLHRLAKGEYRVVNPARARAKLSTKRTSFPQPSRSEELISAPLPPPVSEAASSPINPVDAQIHESFLCPRCKYRIGFSTTPDQRVVEKPCFSCLSVVSYDRRDRTAVVLAERRPVFVASLDDTHNMKCVVCQNEFRPLIRKATDGKKLICCFSCNTIYLPDIYRKSLVDRACPSPGCGNTIRFKINQNDEEARQFCFECMNRLLYKRSGDEVTISEKLVVPQITVENLDNEGVLCPHCHNPASGRHTINSRKQKLSICWNCKNVFELVYKTSVIPLRRTDG